ncbi:hypothetical protein [Actinocorallia populi]|uniref:hypothetical protein n=1 Tax=Actinocorallia populi TaxID=2079200 RepID=UPI000D08665E|nr:hypothetical protein [Actinocorallia populi]
MPQSPLVHRVLRSSGYSLTALLVLAAVGVLLWPLMGGGERPSAAPVPSSAPSAQTAPSAAPGTAEQGENPFTAIDPGTDRREEKQGDGPCGTKAAYYKRVGGGIEVTVVYAGFGAVRAIVVPANGEPLAQSYTTSGNPTPHVFKFEDVSPQAIKKVGLTVTSGTGGEECELQRK